MINECEDCGENNLYYEPAKGQLTCRDCGHGNEVDAKKMPSLESMSKRIVSLTGGDMEHIRFLQRKFFYRKDDQARRYAATFNILNYIEHNPAYKNVT